MVSARWVMRMIINFDTRYIYNSPEQPVPQEGGELDERSKILYILTFGANGV
jgi:hypothetical protein